MKRDIYTEGKGHGCLETEKTMKFRPSCERDSLNTLKLTKDIPEPSGRKML